MLQSLFSMDGTGSPASPLSVVIVNWNGAALLPGCLEPLKDSPHQVILIDNGSTDDSLDLLARSFPQVTVVANQGNVGFARACNQGLRLSTTNAVLFLNNDTIPDLRAFDELSRFLEQRPEIGVAGPTLVNVDGTPQTSCGPGPNLWTELLAKTLLHRVLPGIRELAPTGSRRVDWVTGAALCIRRDLAMQLGGFDESMFMFYEDLDLCARAREAGREVWFLTTPPIVHLGGATRRKVEAASLIHSYRSADRFFERHGPPWRRQLLRVLTVPEVTLRAGIWRSMLLSPGRRDLARERLRAYRAILQLATRPGPALDTAPSEAPNGVGARVSIAMCTFNGEPYLAAQLDSIAAQTRPPDELVVCDDGSADATVSILEKFAAQVPFPVRIQVNQQNLGYVKNFEQAISMCSGDLIALCDQDDVWQPTKLARSQAELARHPEVGLVFTDAEVVDENLRSTGSRLQNHTVRLRDQVRADRGRATTLMLRRTLVTGTTMMFRSSFRDDVLPIPANWVHDAWISFVISVRARLRFIAEPLVLYRQHGGNQIGFRDPGSVPYRMKNAMGARRDEFVADAERWPLARDRIASLPVEPTDVLDASARQALLVHLSQKEHHMRTRGLLPSNRLQRLPVIARELARGNYHRYSAGFHSVLKDVLLETDA